MKFQLTIQTSKPTKTNVLDDIPPLSGVEFLEAAVACLRRCLDNTSRFRHQTLGALASYTIEVPQRIAIESRLFDKSANATLVVSENILQYYLFYGATLTNAASNRPCYPYVTNEIVLTTYVDCIRFLADWANTGFATKVKMTDHGVMVPDTSKDDQDDGKKPGQGCDGCPVHPHPGPDGRPGGWMPRPDPWYQPGPNTPFYPKPMPQPPYPPAPPAPKPSGSGASRPTGTATTVSTSGIPAGTIMLGDDILTDAQFNALFN